MNTNNKILESEIDELKELLKEKDQKIEDLSAEVTFYKQIIDNAPLYIVYQDLDLNYRYVVNPQITKTSEEMIGKNEFQLLPFEEAQRLTDIKRRVIDTGIPHDFVIQPTEQGHSKKNILKGSYIPVRNERNKIVGILGHATNISKEHEHREYLNNLFDLVPDMVAIMHKEGHFIRTNRAWENILGYSEEELMKLPIRDLVHPDDLQASRKRSKQHQTKEPNTRYINRYLCKDGSYKSIEWSFIHSPDGLAYLTIGRDISKRLQDEIELRDAKTKAVMSDRLKTEFINNLSHEIRTPMNGILGFANMLGKPNITPDRHKHYLNILKNSGHQLLRVIDDILEISKLETKHVRAINEPMCLNDLLLEMFSIFSPMAKEKKLQLYFNKTLNDKDSTIISDDTKILKIVSNLLENAIKYTSTGLIELGYYLQDKNICIYVKDTGVGIHAKHHQLIFDRFSRENDELHESQSGLGLGLSIARENTEILGGQIMVESTKGKGSTFTVTLPYNMVDTTATNKDLSSPSILLVEDEEVNALYLQTVIETLTQDNVMITHAKNGQEAVDLCHQKDFDLVFMDLKMPIMDGFTATALIKDQHPDLTIIAQTAYTTEDFRTKALNNGCCDCILKPISEEIIQKVLSKYLN